MTRREAREVVMKLVFQREFHKADENFNLNFVEDKVNDDVKKYITNVITLFDNNKDYIDELIEKYADNWKMDRINRVDLSIIRLAVTEILYIDNISEKVAINEAVEIAKKYSGESAAKFVNGVLGKIVRSEVSDDTGD